MNDYHFTEVDRTAPLLKSNETWWQWIRSSNAEECSNMLNECDREEARIEETMDAAE